jgi:hypothetical protein
VGPGELPFALISATEQMLDAPDANSLWPVMAREAARLIIADAVAVVRHSAPPAGLVVAFGGSTPGAVSSWYEAIEAAAQLGWLWEPRRIDDLGRDGVLSAAELPLGSPGWRSLLVVALDGRHSKDVTRLAWFSAHAAAFDRCVEVAHLFGRHASAAVRDVRAREALSQGIASRHRICQAQGILMARYGLTSEQAFEALKRRSQGTNLKLRMVADQVIRSGQFDKHWMTGLRLSMRTGRR